MKMQTNAVAGDTDNDNNNLNIQQYKYKKQKQKLNFRRIKQWNSLKKNILN